MIISYKEQITCKIIKNLLDAHTRLSNDITRDSAKELMRFSKFLQSFVQQHGNKLIDLSSENDCSGGYNPP